MRSGSISVAQNRGSALGRQPKVMRISEPGGRDGRPTSAARVSLSAVSYAKPSYGRRAAALDCGVFSHRFDGSAEPSRIRTLAVERAPASASRVTARSRIVSERRRHPKQRSPHCASRHRTARRRLDPTCTRTGSSNDRHTDDARRTSSNVPTAGGSKTYLRPHPATSGLNPSAVR
jgi:hypothetical protein